MGPRRPAAPMRGLMRCVGGQTVAWLRAPRLPGEVIGTNSRRKVLVPITPGIMVPLISQEVPDGISLLMRNGTILIHGLSYRPPPPGNGTIILRVERPHITTGIMVPFRPTPQ